MTAFSSPCSCLQTRIPLHQTTTLDDDGMSIHRLTMRCDNQADPYAQPPMVEPPPPAFDASRITCAHGEQLLVTGSDPAATLALLGCPCSEARAS